MHEGGNLIRKIINRYNKLAAKGKPDEVINKLRLQRGNHVLEIGVGGGYYAQLFASTIGDKGIYAGLDVDEALLENLAQMNAASEYENMHPFNAANLPIDELGDIFNQKLSVQFDVVFTRDTYHHLKDRVRYFSSLLPCIKEGGRLAVIDYDESWSLYRLFGHYTPKAMVFSEIISAGYVLEGDYSFLPWQSFLVFQKPAVWDEVSGEV